jgi:hypothetical protein
MIIEGEIRRVLTEDAAATTWSLTARDVVDHTPLADVVPLAARRRRPLVLGAVAASVALVGGAGVFAIVRQSRHTPRIAVGTPQVGTPAVGAGDLAGMTLLLPKPVLAGYAVAAAEVQPTSGYSVVYDGAPRGFVVDWSYTVRYTRENLGQPDDESLVLSVMDSGPAAVVVGSTNLLAVDGTHTGR